MIILILKNAGKELLVALLRGNPFARSISNYLLDMVFPQVIIQIRIPMSNLKILINLKQAKGEAYPVIKSRRIKAEEVYKKVLFANYRTTEKIKQELDIYEWYRDTFDLPDFDIVKRANRFGVILRRAHNTALRHWCVPASGLSFSINFWIEE